MKRTWFAATIVVLFGMIVGVPKVRADNNFYWHYLLTQQGRNNVICMKALSYPDDAYGGQCKVWVSTVVGAASSYVVALPLNSPYCDWQWLPSSNVQYVCSDQWNYVPFQSGQIIQAQVRYSHYPYTSPHTMIVIWASADTVSVIESNYGVNYPNLVHRRTVSWAAFKADVIHYTLYQVK